jgi:hypothetical protein
MIAKLRIFFILFIPFLSAVWITLSSANVEFESENLDKIYARYVQAKLESTHDSNLLRRLSLHLRGTIPDGKESLEFAKNSESDKLRLTSIQYLQSPEFAEYWATKLGSLFREQTNRRDEVYGGFYKYLANSLHEDKPYDILVREMITAEGDLEKNPAGHFYARDSADPLQVAEYVGRVFYAKRVGCARCHDDKFDKSFTQRDYYAIAAFFSQQFYRTGWWDEKRLEGEAIPNIPNEDIENLPLKEQKIVKDRNREWDQTYWNKMSKEEREKHKNKNLLKFGKLYYEERLGIRFPIKDDKPGGDLVQPKFPDGTIPEIKEGSDRRKIFVDWLVAKENPRFRKVIINRIWRELMGWAFFTPEDDWNKDTVIQAEDVLNHLDQVFLEKNHSIKELIFYIVNSQAYARRTPANEEEKSNRIQYFPSRRMDPDQLMNSIVKGTLEVDQPKWLFSERRLTHFFTKKVNLKGKGELKIPDKDQKDSKFASQMERPARPNQFLAIFGSGNRTDVEDDHTEITIDQVLTLMNGRLTGKAAWDFGGKDSQSVKTFEATKSMSSVVNDPFLILLGREMTGKEKELLISNLPKGDGHFERQILQDFVWAILNSQEFLHVN